MKPIKNDFAMTQQVMAFNEIKTVMKKYVKMKREEK